MRLLGAFLTTLVILGGLRCFFWSRSQSRSVAVAPVVQTAEERFTLEATLTFDAGADEFALEPDTSLVVECLGKRVVVHREPIKAGAQLTFALDHPFVVGTNELFVRAHTGAAGDRGPACDARPDRSGRRRLGRRSDDLGGGGGTGRGHGRTGGHRGR